MKQKEETFTPSEAAAICRLALRSIQREIDEGPVSRARPARIGDRRRLNEHDLLYFAVVRDFEKLLSKRGRELIYEALRKYSPLSPKSALKERTAVLGLLDIQKARSELTDRLSGLARAKAVVTSDPEIRGGEPIIKGTRIGVYEVATMLRRGASNEEILSGYPTLRSEHLELAVIYAKAYPRRGRPPRHPWAPQTSCAS